MKRTTIKDIALKLGVSVSTVSRALNNHPDISEKVKDSVRATAKELNYHANLLAVNLRNSRSGLIALIIPEITMFFFPSVINGIEEEVRKQGYQLLVLQSNDSYTQECHNLHTCLDLAVDGVLLSLSAESQDTGHLHELIEAQIPVVLFDKYVKQDLLDQVIINDYEAAAICTQELINTGAKKICGIFGNKQMNITQQRQHGFVATLADAGLAPANIVFAQGMDAVAQEVLALLKHQNIDGYFCMSDETIAGVHTAYATLGLPVPAIKAISDGHLPYMVNPRVGHVHHSGYELGKLAADCLLMRLKHKNPYEEPAKTVYLPCRFVEVN